MLFLLLGLACLAFAGLRTWNYYLYIQRRRRRRRTADQPLDMITIGLYAAGALLLLIALLTTVFSGPATDPTDSSTTEPTVETTEAPITGWDGYEGRRRYLQADGTYAKGWLDLDGKRFYLDEEGLTLSGWQEVEGVTRYFREDGSMARGEEVIDGQTYFFTSTGVQVDLVNPWHEVPEDYEVELTDLSVVYATDGIRVDVRIYDALIDMMDDCNEQSGARCCVTSGYRTMEDQESIYNNKINTLMNNGYSMAEAEAEAATAVAVPGTSEHQIGLAVDIVDTQSWSLDEFQDSLPAQKWLIEHSWEYGFILRYPDGKTEVTGIIYEPWHYRYVGVELAKELHDSGLTLEEYIDSLD